MPAISLRKAHIHIDDENLLPFAALLVFLGATGTILLALAFEYFGGYAPCPMCLQQRWAYYAGIPLAAFAGLFALYDKRDTAVLALTLAGAGFFLNAGFGAFHAGVEWGWWPGPASCVQAGLNAPSGNLLQSLSETRVVACDKAAWRFLGISFAGYNAVISLALAAIGFAGCWQGRREESSN